MESEPLLTNEDKDDDGGVRILYQIPFSSFQNSFAYKKKSDLTNRTQRFFLLTCPFFRLIFLLVSCLTD